MIDADVVEGDRCAERTQVLHGAKHLARAFGERALGEFEDDPEVLAGLADGGGVLVRDAFGDRDRFDVHEDGRGTREPVRGGAAERGGATSPVEFGHAAVATRRSEEVAGHRERRVDGTARERLERNGLTGVEVDDRLEVADDPVAREEAIEFGEVGIYSRHRNWDEGGHFR